MTEQDNIIMDNNEFWRSISNIISNKFDQPGTKQLEQYAQQFIAGRLLFARYTDNEQFGCATGGTIHVIASILAGAETPADQLTAPEGSFKREQQRAQAQSSNVKRIGLDYYILPSLALDRISLHNAL